MNCKKVQDLLYDYTNGELDIAVKAEIKMHLKGCELCQNDYAVLVKIKNTVKHDILTPPQTVLKRIKESSTNTKPSGIRAFPVLKPVLIHSFIIGLFLILGGFLYFEVFDKTSANELSKFYKDIYNISNDFYNQDSKYLNLTYRR